MNDVELPKLGESSERYDVLDREGLATLSLSMVEQTRQTIEIVSRNLDPAIYDQDEFVSAVKQLVLGRRRAQIRIILMDSGPLLRQGHRLIELAIRLPSYISFRNPGRSDREFNEAMLVADTIGYIRRQFADRFEGEAVFRDRRGAEELRRRFEKMWERASPDPNLRRLSI
ncbi:MAG: hypothetical protein AAF384_17210 [Pseudomonadota bacterium]